jgi:hypothetical protein
MKTEDLELTWTEIQYLYCVVADHIDSGIYWGNQEQFIKMQEKLFDKITETWDMLNPGEEEDN